MIARATSAAGAARCLARDEALRLREQDDRALFVDSLQGAPAEMARFQCFNPFATDAARPLDVPGRVETSHSVEAIWQGLKLVQGTPAFEMFGTRPWKRPSDAERRVRADYVYADSEFLFGDEVVDLVTARYSIYLPAYRQLLARRVTAAVHEEINAALCEGRDVVFYDWDDNFDITNARSSFSHSALLASWYGGRWFADVVRPAVEYTRARWPRRSLPAWLEAELGRMP